MRNQPTLTKQTAAADLMMTNATNDNISDDVVDAAEAGEGNLEILVTAGPGNNIPTRVEPLGGARFNVTFSPRTADTHSVVVTFNDEPVRGTKITETRATLSPVPGSLFLESETRNYRMSSPRV